jgi:hypothetical protein
MMQHIVASAGLQQYFQIMRRNAPMETLWDGASLLSQFSSEGLERFRRAMPKCSMDV